MVWKHRERTAKGEKIGGGFFVFRRHKKSGRIAPNPHGFPFEYETHQAAAEQATILALKCPGETFDVFARVNSITYRDREIEVIAEDAA